MSYKILVVEDEPDVRENIAEILTVNSYQVVTAANGKKAMEKLISEIPDLIISDISMPELNGHQLLDFVQSSKHFSHLPFIFLTAKASYEEVREGMTRGADDYLIKPFKSKDLLDMISVRLKKAQKLKRQVKELKENIALSVPHELRTPITPILGYSGIMVDDAEFLTPNEINEIGHGIKKSALRLSSTVEKFIFFSNLGIELNYISKNDELLNAVTENLEEIVHNIVCNEKGLSHRSQTIIINIEESPLKIHEYYFRACLVELINNAFKFSNPDSTVKITGKSKGDLYNLSIENSGEGLSADKILGLNIFNKKSDPNVPGSGLGLPIVKHITEYFGAEFELISEPGEYTKITVHWNKAELKKTLAGVSDEKRN